MKPLKMLTIPIPEDLKLAFEKACSADGIGISAKVRELISSFLGRKPIYLKPGKKEKP